MSFLYIYRFGFILIAALILATACTEKIDIELDSTYARLVVEGAVTTDSMNHYVLLSITSDYFSNRPSPRIQDAVVELSFGDETLQLIENETIPGRYEAPYAFRGEIGITYDLDISQLDVNQDGQDEIYHATSTMLGGSELEKIEIKYYPTPVASGYMVFMYLYHQPEIRDWFGFKLKKNSDLLTDTLYKYSVLSDEIFDSGYFPGLPVGFLSDDDPREAVHPGDTITFELNCIEESYYNFVSEAQLEIAGNFPLFSGPPSNIVSNIDNGAVGIFAAYSIQRFSVIME
ncbi:MAG: hypothetical protein DRI97_07380 [Bacteroidetes bacterium]|nr:MAG: hypothetical protein DRI97_07380 [Bacteroidota bacterium]